jgi:cobalt-zinc-cadmium efflux system membrane fusion protein
MITPKITRNVGIGLAIAGLVIAGFTFPYVARQADYGLSSEHGSPTTNAITPATPSGGGLRRSTNSVELTDARLSSVKVEPVGEPEFPKEKQAVGSIGFNENMTVQVFTPYQGRIIALFAEVGDDVEKGKTLFTVASPDLLQAEQTIIAAAGVLELTTRNLARLKELYATKAVSQRDLEQATSDQQTAEGALRAARDPYVYSARPRPRLAKS